MRSFPHLADPPMDVIRKYGVVNDRGNGARRSLFVVDREGTLSFINPAYNVNEPDQYQGLFDALARIP